MAESLASNLGGSIAPKLIGDSIILIDHDIASVTFLTSMLERFSYKVMSVDLASKALSIIEKQKNDIGLVLANIEMSDINTHSFLDVLHHKDIPFILINPEINPKETSDLLIKSARFILNKPISENDIKNMWQHVLPKKSLGLNKINIEETQENQIETFRKNIKRHRNKISETYLVGRRSFTETFKTVEWKNKLGCLIGIENKREEEKNMNNIIGKNSSIWTYERHMKILTAITILGEKESRPKSIMKIINDPTLTPRQVASHLQKYKDQVGQISNTLPIKEWKSTDNIFIHPSDITKNHAQYSFKKPSADQKKKDMLKFHPLCSVTNKSFIDANDNLPGLSALPSHSAALTLNCEVPIEDLICFDIDVNDMDIQYWLGNNHLSPNHLDHDSTFNNRMDSTTHFTMDHDHFRVMNFGSTSHQHNMESGNQFDYDRDCMDWIEQMLDQDD